MNGPGSRNYWLGRWAQALRSGGYQQIEGCLHDGVGFCGNGVLVDQLIQDGLLPAWEPDQQGIPRAWGPGGHEEKGYHEIARLFPARDMAREVWMRNDAGRTFDRIADYIDSLMDVEPALVAEREVVLT